jgi:hypothetical protein
MNLPLFLLRQDLPLSSPTNESLPSSSSRTYVLRVEIPPIEININQGSQNQSAVLKLLTDIATSILNLKETTMATLADIQAAVAAENSVVQSAVTLLQGLKAQLDAAIASNDPAALAQLSSDIQAQTAALSAAVAANTPAAPAA